VHPVNAALLAAGGGRYRCGKCNKLVNALESLFDDWPEPGAKPPAAAEPPVLGAALDLDAAARARRLAREGAVEEDESDPRARGSVSRWALRLTWITGLVVIAVVVAFQLARFQGEPLLERGPVRSALERVGLEEPPSAVQPRDLDRIHLVSRELRSHPERGGWLRLSATIVNRAPHSQPWPDLEVTLLDAAGAAVTRQMFSPREYLASGRDPARGMAPQAYLPLVVELEDPGMRAVGFELEFR
jgi:hypothetical protein